MRFLGAAAVTAGLLVVPLASAAVFGRAANIPIAGQPVSVILADATQDGTLDIVTANSASPGISVLPGRGNGSFERALGLAPGSGARALASGDFDDDGAVDLALATANGVTIYPGLDAGVVRGETYAIDSPASLAAVDLDSDGIDPSASADEITSEYVEVTVAEALEDLHSPGAGDFFGRITDEHADRWYIGRRHIEDDAHDPVVVDWRAPIAAPFYRATGVDPLGLSHRRRFTMVDGDLSAYLDEQLDDPDSRRPPPACPTRCSPRSARREPVRCARSSPRSRPNRMSSSVPRSISAWSCRVGRAPARRRSGLHRAAFLLFEHRRRLSRNGVLVVGPNSVFLDYIANVLPSLGERLVQQRTALDICVPKVEITVPSTTTPRGVGRARRRCSIGWPRRASATSCARPRICDCRSGRERWPSAPLSSPDGSTRRSTASLRSTSDATA